MQMQMNIQSFFIFNIFLPHFFIKQLATVAVSGYYVLVFLAVFILGVICVWRPKFRGWFGPRFWKVQERVLSLQKDESSRVETETRNKLNQVKSSSQWVEYWWELLSDICMHLLDDTECLEGATDTRKCPHLY
jgi:hypothetical protein